MYYRYFLINYQVHLRALNTCFFSARGRQLTCPCHQHVKDVKAGAIRCNYAIIKEEETLNETGEISVNSLGVKLLYISFLEI